MNTQALPPVPEWNAVPGYRDILYAKADEGIAKITINRPEVRNAFRPQTVQEMERAFDDARDDENIGVVILTGRGATRSAPAATSACAATAATWAPTACRA